MAIEVELDASAARALAGNLAGAAGLYEREVALFLERLSRYAQAEGQRGSPVRTGTLRRSWAVQSRGPYASFVGPSVDYAEYVSRGRGAIEAAPGSVLRFTLPDGTVVFTKRVGPAAPNPFVENAAAATRAQVRTEAAMLVANIRRAIVGG